MLVKTRFFGEVQIEEEKILTFENGIMGFDDKKSWTIIYDIDKGAEGAISWLQSLELPELALPIISPYSITDTYAPVVEDELLKPLGEFKDEELLIFLTLTIPSGSPKDTTANFKAPILINPLNKRGLQIIANNEDYQIKTRLEDSLAKKKEKK